MAALLTWNGIPPQIVGSLTEEQRQSIVCYATNDKHETYIPWSDHYPEAIQPFAAIVETVASRFIEWGAIVGAGLRKIDVISSHVGKDEATFKGDQQLHSDLWGALPKLQTDDFLSLRFLCVSSGSGTFVDVTKQNNATEILDSYCIDNGRFYKTEFLDWAEASSQVVKPRNWDVIMFDATTPHQPTGASQPHRRILQHAWIDIKLPTDWRSRILGKDFPKL